MNNLIRVVLIGAAGGFVMGLVLAGSCVLYVRRRRARAAVVEPAPVYRDPDDTVVVKRLTPMVEMHRREAYNDGLGDGLRHLQAVTSPPPYLAKSDPRVVARRRARTQPYHDMTQPGAPAQRVGQQRYSADLDIED